MYTTHSRERRRGSFTRRLALVTGAAIVAMLALASSALSHGALPTPDPEVPDVAGECPARSSSTLGETGGSGMAKGHGVSNDPTAGDEAVAGNDAGDERMRLSTYESHKGMEATSRELVYRYRDEADCLLRQAGYLDLLGGVWGCVVEGPGWVDVCVVREQEQDERCMVSVARMEVTAWEERYGQ